MRRNEIFPTKMSQYQAIDRHGVGHDYNWVLSAQEMNRRPTRTWNHVRQSAVLATLLTVVVMVFAVAGYGPSISHGGAEKLVVVLLNAPVYMLNTEALFAVSPVLFFGVIALLEFLYFLLISIVVRTCIDALRPKRSKNAL